MSIHICLYILWSLTVFTHIYMRVCARLSKSTSYIQYIYIYQYHIHTLRYTPKNICKCQSLCVLYTMSIYAKQSNKTSYSDSAPSTFYMFHHTTDRTVHIQISLLSTTTQQQQQQQRGFALKFAAVAFKIYQQRMSAKILSYTQSTRLNIIKSIVCLYIKYTKVIF